MQVILNNTGYRIEVIKADNDRLKAELRELREAKKASDLAEQRASKVEKRQPKRDPRKIPGNILTGYVQQI